MALCPHLRVAKNKLWGVTLVISLMVAFFFLLPQLSVIILSCLMAFIFAPVYTKLKRPKSKGWGAAIITVILSLLSVIIPVIIVLSITVAQLLNAAETLLHSGTFSNLDIVIAEVNRMTNSLIAPLNLQVNLTGERLTELLRTTLPQIARTLGESLLGFLSSIPQLAIAILIYTYVFVELLVNKNKYIQGLYGVSPFSKTITTHYLDRVGMMANAMVKGQLIISVIISVISVILLVPLGYGPYSFILFVLFTVLNFIPLGSGIVMFPLVIDSGLTGQFWLALVILILYFVVANIDGVLRPIFIPKKIQLSAALTLISTFCGIAYFGTLGVVYGPIIMILITTALSLYQENKVLRA